MCGAEKDLVVQIHKAHANTLFKACVGYSLYCSAAGTLWKILELILCYQTSSVKW